MSETQAGEALPAIDIAVGAQRTLFVQRMVFLAKSKRHMAVEFYQDTFGNEGLHFANFLLPNSSKCSRSGGQLIVRPDEARVCVEMRSAQWHSGYPTRDEYIQFSRDVFCPLLHLHNREFGTRYRMRVRRPRSNHQLPPQAMKLFERFAVLANVRSLHPLDWERFYLFVRNSRQEAPEGVLGPLLIKKGFSVENARMLECSSSFIIICGISRD